MAVAGAVPIVAFIVIVGWVAFVWFGDVFEAIRDRTHSNALSMNRRRGTVRDVPSACSEVARLHDEARRHARELEADAVATIRRMEELARRHGSG